MATHRQGSALSKKYVLRKMAGLCALALPALSPQFTLAQERSINSESVEDSMQVALPTVTVSSTAATPVTEGNGSYSSDVTTAGTGLLLGLRETPQSVSVITRQRMEDQQLNSIRDVLENTTGISTSTLDSERISFYARGFSIDSLGGFKSEVQHP